MNLCWANPRFNDAFKRWEIGPLLVFLWWVALDLAFGGDLKDVAAPIWLVPALGVPGMYGFLRVFWHPQKRMWHDNLSGTYVVKVPRRSSREIPGNQSGIRS